MAGRTTVIGAPPVVPELDVSDLARSLAAYEGVLGFECRVTRPEERFAYLVREGAHLMLQEAAGPGRRFRTAPLAPPFGRGVNLQIEVSDVDALHAAVARSDLVIHVPLEERWYRQADEETGVRQFVVADPDGYLLRFGSDLGRRAVEKLEPPPDTDLSASKARALPWTRQGEPPWTGIRLAAHRARLCR